MYKNLSELINEVRYRHDSIILKKGDKSIAALIDIELFDQLRLLKSQTNSSNDGDSSALQQGEQPLHLNENLPTNEQETEDKDILESLED